MHFHHPAAAPPLRSTPKIPLSSLFVLPRGNILSKHKAATCKASYGELQKK